MDTLAVLLLALSAPVLGAAAYLGLLAALAKRPRRGQREQEAEGAPALRFDIVIPAHDEEASITDTVKSVAAADYPERLRRILVVADNCTDKTAERAEAAGALVLTRTDAAERGKGYALAFAFQRILGAGSADAVVVIDADTTVSKNILLEFNRRLSRGAGAVQAEYTVRNPNASWRTRLMVIALAIFHLLRSLARERLRLSAGLRGNGMGFSCDVLRRVPYEAYSLVEDVEYGIKLGEAGCRVEFVPEAQVFGEMVARARASRSQRRRWEGGRATLARGRGLALLGAGIAKRSPMLIDLALDLLIPPLTTLALITLAGAGLALAVGSAAGRPWLIAGPWLASAGLLVVYVLRGWQLSGAGLRGLVDLGWAPVYILWKIGISIMGSKPKDSTWVRTARADASDDGKEHARGH